MQVITGAIADVVVDIRVGSPDFGKSIMIKLDGKTHNLIYVPEGFAHGFLGLKKENIIYYYNTNYRSAKHEIGLLWNDKTLKIKWPTKHPIISEKDKKNLKFEDFKKLYIKK